MPAMSPRTNGELQDALTTAKGAWAACAAKVDMIVNAQDKAQAEIEKKNPGAKHD